MEPFVTPEVREIALTLMEGLSCARSLTVAILVRYDEWDQLVNLTADPLLFNCPDSYWAANAASEFLRKCAGLPTSYDLEKVSLEKFWEAERACYKSNERLGPLLLGRANPAYNEALDQFVWSVRKKIRDYIGTCPPSAWEGRFGPGATMSDNARYTTVPDKLSSVPTLTSNAWPFLVPWTGTKWATAQAALGNSPTFIRGNAFFTVPKDARSKRGCAKEPAINGFFQLGLGRVMKDRLLRWGLDLKWGQDVHRQVAYQASIRGHLATIDLSSASDTVCYNLVKLLLPPAWFEALDALRSPFTKVGKNWVRLEKFSSMGNGYTFELETVLFAAIAATACDGSAREGESLFVFGDDIIVPTDRAADVIAALRYFGFTPNKRKTFVDGVFRESCGGDYFSGQNVRAHYLEEQPNEPQHYISLANGLRRMALSEPDSRGRWDRVRRAWFRCLDNVPEHIRTLRGPERLGDLVIHDDEPRWCTRWRANGVRYIKSYKPVPRTRVRWEGFGYDVQFAAALYGVARDPKGDLIPRDPVIGYKVCWVADLQSDYLPVPMPHLERRGHPRLKGSAWRFGWSEDVGQTPPVKD